MLDNNFDNYVQHKKEHDNFLEVISDLIEKFRIESELSYGKELEKKLQHWVVNHITTSDRELATAKTDE